ncbi:MAG TPA: hypothetical protein DEV72_02795 [Ktedonobacter sp.]|jgi:hypothetical protein|nr:hypothetical protein [Ktedonobacter sp.]
MEEEKRSTTNWQTLRNPFNTMDTSAVITGHISGRSTDIIEIITGGQGAIVLAGAPSIGKSALIQYLQLPPGPEWSWRNELSGLYDEEKLKNVHFVQIDLSNLDGIETKEELLSAFITRCASALHSINKKRRHTVEEYNLKGLIEMLRNISEEDPGARYFVMLDTIERLGRFGIPSFKPDSKAETPQERALALLDHGHAIRTLVDLIDEFRTFGFILSIESLARSKVADQFTHVSADLARFKTITLQTFTRRDAGKFLAQKPESFGIEWAKSFNDLSKNDIFSEQEQEWLLEQAGTHPYLLQQFCFYAFHLKQEYARLHGTWTELQESGKKQLFIWINERLNTFFAHIWNRLQEALNSDGETKEKTLSDFREFVNLLAQKQANDEIDLALWDHWGSELHYILCSEGVIRYDPFQPIHFPGIILRQYLVQKTKESGDFFIPPLLPSSTGGRGFLLTITRSEKLVERLSLSDLEYHLLKTLLQNPRHCSELELMIGAWGEKIEKSKFIQRMHHLRKKLREQCETEIVENRYGGLYSINHPEWFHLD